MKRQIWPPADPMVWTWFGGSPIFSSSQSLTALTRCYVQLVSLFWRVVECSSPISWPAAPSQAPFVSMPAAAAVTATSVSASSASSASSAVSSRLLSTTASTAPSAQGPAVSATQRLVAPTRPVSVGNIPQAVAPTPEGRPLSSDPSLKQTSASTGKHVKNKWCFSRLFIAAISILDSNMTELADYWLTGWLDLDWTHQIQNTNEPVSYLN